MKYFLFSRIYCFGGHGPAIEDYLCNSGEYVKDHSSGTVCLPSLSLSFHFFYIILFGFYY